MADLAPVRSAEGLSLSRWSRLKRGRGEPAALLAPGASAASDAVSVASALSAAEVADAAHAANAASVAELNLPDLASISLVEDFTPFMQAKVPQLLRQQALKALFKEPHFNIMDGLDTYIDDYTVFEPITPEVMATLSSWKTIMNPTKQVVTPGGYAVDVESEEGKSVLAARAEAELRDQGSSPSDDTSHPSALPQVERGSESLNPNEVSNEQGSAPSPLAGDATNLSPTGFGGEAADEPAQQRPVTPAIQHPRHNKRVSDFAYFEAPAAVDTPLLSAEKAE